MIDADEVSVWLAAGVLRGSDHEIEALTLEATASDAAPGALDEALEKSSKSEQRGGALGMEIVGAIIIPVLIEAARQFWASYQKQLIEKSGKAAADATLEQIKEWFAGAPAAEQQDVGQKLAQAIRRVGEERKLKIEDIDALVAATAPERLSSALAAG